MLRQLIKFAYVALLYSAITLLPCVVVAQADSERCDQVDLDSLKLDEFSGGWSVRDITNGWGKNFITKTDAERFMAVLRGYKIKTHCTRLFGHSLMQMSYMLTDGNQSPQGELAGESCVAFDPATLKVLWSDEKKGFVLTDEHTVVVSETYFRKGDYEEILGIVKKYTFEMRCRLREWKYDSIDYWKLKPAPITRIDRPSNIGRETLALAPPSYPLVCRGARDMLVGIKPERKLALIFQRSSYPASVGLSPGQCSWLDRGVRKEEPNVLIHQVGEGRDSAPEYNWREALKDPGIYWTFKVYNDGQGQLVVTSAKLGGAPKPTPAGMEDWESLGGNIGSGPAVAVQRVTSTEGAAHLFAKGSEGALWTRSRVAGKWTEWSSLGGALASAPAAAGAWDSDPLIVVARGPRDEVWFRRLSGGKWTEWKSLGGISTKGAPAIVTRKGNQFAVFAIGHDDAIWQHNFDGLNPGSWVSLEKTNEGIGFLYGPAAVASSVNEMTVFAVGSDTHVYTKTWVRSCDCWSMSWELLDGEVSSAPAAVYMGSGVTIVLALGPGLDLQKARVTSVSTRVRPTWESLGGKLFAAPAALLSGGAEFDVFGVAADNALWWRRFRD